VIIVKLQDFGKQDYKTVSAIITVAEEKDSLRISNSFHLEETVTSFKYLEDKQLENV
jgi:hypothetical protein